jgi:hypothetical protein
MDIVVSKLEAQTLYFAFRVLRARLLCRLACAFELAARLCELYLLGRFHYLILASHLNLGWNPGIDLMMVVVVAGKRFVDLLSELQFRGHLRQVAQRDQRYHFYAHLPQVSCRVM